MTNNELYQSIIKSYNGVLSNSSIIGNLLSNFVVNNKSIGKGVYNDGGYGSQIELPATESEYQTALKTIEEDISDIDTIISKVKLLINNTDNSEDNIYTLNELDKLLDKLSQMKRDREGVHDELYDIFKASENLKNEVEKNTYSTPTSPYTGGGSGGGSSSGGGSKGGSNSGGNNSNNKKAADNTTKQTSDQNVPKTETITTSNYESHFKINSNVSSDLNNSYNSVQNNKASIGGLLSSFIINGQTVGSGIYNDGISGLGSDSIQAPSFDVLVYSIDVVKQDVADTKTLIANFKTDIENLKTAIAELEADIKVQAAVPRTITYGRGTIEDPYVEKPNPAYDDAQKKIVEDKAQIEANKAKITEDESRIAELDEDLTKKEEVYDQLVKYYNGLYELVGKNIDLFTAWSLYENLNEHNGDLEFNGAKLSDEEALSVFNKYLSEFQNNPNQYALSLPEMKSGIYDFTQADFNQILGATQDAKEWFDYKLGNGPNPFTSTSQEGGNTTSFVDPNTGQTVVVGGIAAEGALELGAGIGTQGFGLNGNGFTSTSGPGSIDFNSERVSTAQGDVTVWYARINGANNPYLYVANDSLNTYIAQGGKYTQSGPIADPLEMAEASGATLVINCGRLNAGPIIADYNVIRSQGAKSAHEVYGETLYMTSNGQLGAVTNIQNGQYTAMEQLSETNPEWAIMGFHRIIEDGQDIAFADRATNDNPNDEQDHPRTLIGQTSNGDYIVIVVSGARGNSAKDEPGMTMEEVQEFVHEKFPDVDMVYNGDGGGSSFLYYNGQQMDNITDNSNPNNSDTQWFAANGRRYLPNVICFD